MTPGPTTPSQPSPLGIGGSGSSAFFHGSSPDLASRFTVSPWANEMLLSFSSFGLPSETHGHVGHEAFERSPHIGSPAATHSGSGPHQRLISRLTHVEKIFEVGDDFHRPELPHCDRHRVDVRFRSAAVRVVIQHLRSVVDAFDADPIGLRLLQHQVGTDSMAIEKRHRLPATGFGVSPRATPIAVSKQKLVCAKAP